MVAFTVTAAEQLQLELINRARLDPAAEAARLGIALNEGLAAGTISTAAQAPLAMNSGLHDAATEHSIHMINVDLFNHVGIGDGTPATRAALHGYTGYSALGENIGAVSGANQTLTTVQLYESLFRDAGIAGRGHRTNILSTAFNEVGIGQSTGLFKFPSGTTLNSTLVTQDFGNRGNVYVTGVAYNDTNGNKFYDIGEARGGVNVAISGRDATTGAAGGYAIETSGLPASKSIQFSGGGLSAPVNATVSGAAGQNIKVDLVGTNSIYSSGNTTLGAGAVNLTLLGINGLTGVGNAAANTIDGTRSGNVLFGQDGADILRGNGGNDGLHGGTGADKLFGGVGNDFLFGGAGTDVLNGGDGTDTASYLESPGTVGVTARLDLPSLNKGDALGETYVSIENLTGTSFGDVLVGNSGANLLFGAGGNDALFGQAGADNLQGSSGFDFLEGGAGADVLNGGTEFDSALYTFATAAVTANLANKALNTGDAAGDSYVSIEGLGGSKFNDKLTGDAFGNAINGGLGNDILAGGAGPDAFAFSTALNATTNVDNITDFNVAADIMWLQKAGVFTSLTLGALGATEFRLGTAAVDANDHIIYNKTTGDIFYDSNGNAAGGMTKFAHVTANTALTAADFFVV